MEITFATRTAALQAIADQKLKNWEPVGYRANGVTWFGIRFAPWSMRTQPVKVRRFKRKGPVGIVRKFVRDNPTMGRREAIEALVAMGINRTTAGVQFGKAKKA